MKHRLCLFLTLFCVSLSIGAAPDNTLRYGESSRFDTFDPYTSQEASTLRLSELLFNGLIKINKRQEIIPDLAERWDISADKKTFTFYLRKEVFWHNKEQQKYPLTADDVIFTINLIKHPKTQSTQQRVFQHFSQFKKIDSHTLQITLKEKTIASLALFQFKILPKHQLQGSDHLTKKNAFANNPIGTGPYQFFHSNRNREVTLVASPAYYAGEANIKRIIAKPFADKNMMIQALKFDALDLIVDTDPRHIAELRKKKQFRLKPYNTLSYSFFAYNQNNPHLAQQAVRKAISYAVNRTEMLKAFFNHQGLLISGPFAPGSWAYNLDISADPFDPEKARTLLSDAGYTKTKKGLIDQTGTPLSFSLKVPMSKNDETTKRVILTYVNYLKKIGIKVKVNFMERQTWKKAVFFRHQYDITFTSWAFDDGANITTLFHSDYRGAGQNNFIQYQNPRIDELLELNEKSLDFEEKRTLSHQLHEILAHDSPYTFLWSLNHYATYNKKLTNIDIHPYRFFSNIETWRKN